MSEQTQEHAPTPQDVAKPAPPAEPAQAETDWKAEARKWESRAKENAEARKELDSIRDAQKSEAEKAADRVAAAEKSAADALAELLRFKVAGKHGITDPDDIELFLTGSDEETLTRQAQRLSDRNAEASQPRRPLPDPNQGRSTQGATSTADQFAAALSDVLNH